MPVIIKGERILDGTGAAPLLDAGVVVEGDTIRHVARLADLPAAAATWETIDLSHYTILPGLIDVHSHLCMDAMGDEWQQMRQPPLDVALRAVKYARICLASGVTTMRTVGERYFIDVAYKQALEDGTFPGPHVLISTRPLIATNGFGDHIGFVADGPEEIRKVVRGNLKAGADWIKVFVTGGGGNTKPSSFQQFYSLDEIRAAVDVAHSFGIRVAAHAHGGPGMRAAIEAGVDTIEHGHYVTDDDVALMAEKGTALVATQTINLFDRGSDRPVAPTLLEHKARVKRIAGQNVKKAREHGVRVTAGTDAMHGLMPVEVEYLVTYGGLTAMEAIVAATKTAAEVCGVEQETGTLEPNKRADIIAVEGNPLEDIRTLQNVRFVMKAGQVLVRSK
ncbi:MAG: amidohydrolase family protein [Ardenticatenaceae bacterium]|nr:amidohydrolase family protein [Ardenticatenaceae bacterium]HBY94124.1 Xaa-Pro dipeptidase [Chloroflexota bacterium]